MPELGLNQFIQFALITTQITILAGQVLDTVDRLHTAQKKPPTAEFSQENHDLHKRWSHNSTLVIAAPKVRWVQVLFAELD